VFALVHCLHGGMCRLVVFATGDYKKLLVFIFILFKF
jgi:hypothetical protein